MRTYNTRYSDFNALKAFMQEHDIQDNAQLFVRVHTGIHTIKSIQPFLKQLRKLLPSACVIGSSNVAVIYNATICYKQCLISFTQTDHITIKAAMFSTNDKEPKTLADELQASEVINQAQTAFVFMNHHYHRTSAFVQACNAFAAQVKFIGGIASPPMHHENESSFVICNDQVDANSVVVCGLCCESLITYSNAILGVEQIGQLYTITKSNGSCVEEIDGQNASLWYRNMLDQESFANDPSICKLFPFVLPDQEDSIRILLYDKDNDRLSWNDEIKEQQNIRMSYCSPYVTIEECKKICQDLETQSVESIFAYSCITRNEIMNKCCSWELSPFSQTSLSGALCGGEICNINGLNVYGNCTCSLLSIATQANVHIEINKKALDSIENLGFDNQHILTYLLKSTSNDMYRTNASLSRKILDQNKQMMDTLFMDPITNLANITKYLYDLEHLDFNKMCIISTQNATMLRSHYGEYLCNKESFAKIQRCKEFLDDPKLYFYIHNQDCIMICALKNYNDEQFLQKMKSLFTFLGTIEAKDNNFYYVNEFAIVIHENNLLKKAELTLSSIERSSQRFLVYYPNLGLEDKVEAELECLANIKYAILHDGVQPYFQPIYDNALHQVEKYESLMRLHTKDGRILYPNQFMDTAKKFKLYEDLSRQMITKVMALYRNSDEAVTINLSVQDIESEQTKNIIYDLLRQCEKPQNIIFEIVESEEIHRNNVLVNFIENIRYFGSKIAIDDFGTGYSNLMKLVKLNTDFIKIDGEIIRNMINDETCHKIIDTILFLSKKMQTELVAEFVENSEIQERIVQLGIRYSQGYHFSQPKPYDDFHKKLKMES